VNPSCEWIWELEKESGVRFLVLKSRRTVAPNEQLTVDYNYGKVHGYFRPVKTLLREGVPESCIQRCMCEPQCKKGYDKLLMEKSLQPPAGKAPRKRRREED
jgi:hypothetical protein